MTRPKVDPANRQRTEHACNACKKRKQKCDGHQACRACLKRSATCVYDSASTTGENSPYDPEKRSWHHPSSSLESSISPPDKRVKLGHSAYLPPASASSHIQYSPPNHQLSSQVTASIPRNFGAPLQNPNTCVPGFPSHPVPASGFNLALQMQLRTRDSIAKQPAPSQGIKTEEKEETILAQPVHRIMEDPNGRQIYLGKSAPLSLVKMFRDEVHDLVGGTPFSERTERKLPSQRLEQASKHSALPDTDTTLVLVESFFTNTSGIIEVVDEESFTSTIREVRDDINNKLTEAFRCLLHLICAIGLLTATPEPETREGMMIEQLQDEASRREDPIPHVENFYAKATHLHNLDIDFDGGGFENIQALTLICVYMLLVSRENTAWAYHGMAVRTAYCLGLHKEANLPAGDCDEQKKIQTERRNLLQTLFVLDAFLSSSLGRPTAMREGHFSGNALKQRRLSLPDTPPETSVTPPSNGFVSHGLGPTMIKSCQSIADILENLLSDGEDLTATFAERQIKAIQEWVVPFDSSRAEMKYVGNSVNILHTHLFQCHSITLLTTPFLVNFLQNLNEERRSGRKKQVGRRSAELAQKCVRACCHCIALAKMAHDGGYLPRRDPIAIYFLFSATLCVLANEVFHQKAHSFTLQYSNHCINSALVIMQYFAESDPKGKDFLRILKNFNNVLVDQKTSSGSLQAASTVGRHSSITPWNTLRVLEDTNPYSPLKGSPPTSPGPSGSNLHANITTLQPSLTTSCQPSYQTTAIMDHGLKYEAQNSYSQPGPVSYLPVAGGGLDPALSGHKPPEMDWPHRFSIDSETSFFESELNHLHSSDPVYFPWNTNFGDPWVNDFNNHYQWNN